MLRATSTTVRLKGDGESLAADPDDLRREGLEGARPGREPERDARLLVRAATYAPPEREARHRRRRHREEAPADAAEAARAERRQARDAGAAGPRQRPRGSRAAGARAEVGRPDPAAGSRLAGADARGPAGQARREREGAVRPHRVLPLAEGGHEGAVLRRR